MSSLARSVGMVRGKHDAKLPRSVLEEQLALHIRADKLPEPTREFRFHASRRWRFDFAWPLLRLAAECEGITFEGGRHQRAKGFGMDCEKYNLATLAGWRVLRFTKAMIDRGDAIDMLKRALAQGSE